MNIISEKLINFRVYDANQEVLALADIELPTLEALSETVSGAGIAGERGAVLRPECLQW